VKAKVARLLLCLPQQLLIVAVTGVTLTLSTQIEGRTFNQGGHKFGVGLDFEA